MSLVTASLSLTPAKGGRPKQTGAQLDLQLFDRLCRNQARIYLWHQEDWMRRIKELEEQPLLDEAGQPVDKGSLRQNLRDEMRDDLRDCGAFLGKVAPAMIASKKARKELLAAMPVAELEAQFRAEMARITAGMTDEEWKALEAARAEAKGKTP